MCVVIKAIYAILLISTNMFRAQDSVWEILYRGMKNIIVSMVFSLVKTKADTTWMKEFCKMEAGINDLLRDLI